VNGKAFSKVKIPPTHLVMVFGMTRNMAGFILSPKMEMVMFASCVNPKFCYVHFQNDFCEWKTIF